MVSDDGSRLESENPRAIRHGTIQRRQPQDSAFSHEFRQVRVADRCRVEAPWLVGDDEYGTVTWTLSPADHVLQPASRAAETWL